jgi:methyltransferase (TIGR00027 family)
VQCQTAFDGERDRNSTPPFKRLKSHRLARMAGTAIQPLPLTAFYCCALRAADAASASPVCGDNLAARFIDDETLARLQPALRFSKPAASNVARHRLIDDILRAALEKNRDLRIILLGAGLDTRAFRIRGGRWWEFDDAALFALKEARLPAHTAPNPLTRTTIDFSRDELRDYLTPFAGEEESLVVLEGVSMYLPTSVLAKTAATIRASLPRATVVCDLMSPAFRERFSKDLYRELGRLGAHFALDPTHPRLALEDAGYRAKETISIVGRAREAGTLRIPRWLLNSLLRELRDGYAVWTFVPAG